MAVEIVESRRGWNHPGHEINLSGGQSMDTISHTPDDAYEEMRRLAAERAEAPKHEKPTAPRPCIKCGGAPRINDHKYCRVCWNAYMRSRYSYDQQRDRQLYANYGLSLDEYNALSHAQDDVCAICKQPEMHRPGGKKRTKNIVPMLHVDHNHVTGKIRGLLCSECNTALGMLREDPKRIKALLKYLKDRSE